MCCCSSSMRPRALPIRMRGWRIWSIPTIARWSWFATNGTRPRRRGRKIAAFVRDAHHRFPFLEYATHRVHLGADRRWRAATLFPPRSRRASHGARRFRPRCSTRSSRARCAAMDPPMVDRKRLNLMYVTQVGELAAAARVFLEFRSRHSRALHPLPRDAISQGAEHGRQSAAHAVPARPGRTSASAVRIADAPRLATVAVAAALAAIVEMYRGGGVFTPRRGSDIVEQASP